MGQLLLQPSATVPDGFKERGKIICNCFNIAESEIVSVLNETEDPDTDARITLLKQKLKYGTNCGSFIPELKRITEMVRL